MGLVQIHDNLGLIYLSQRKWVEARQHLETALQAWHDLGNNYAETRWLDRRVRQMPVTYTSLKGLTYYLCQGTTKTGKLRYYFAREIKGEPVAEIPAGYKISESVNGVVSLVKDRPSPLRPQEIAAVEAAVSRHPKGHNYRVGVKGKRIEVYERIGPDAAELADRLVGHGVAGPGLLERLQADQERYDRFTPVLRFTLQGAQDRRFGVERMCYLGSIDGWLELHRSGPVERLARTLIPTLGTDKFFELH